MGQQLQPSEFQIWRSGEGEKLWLSMLIDAMEQVSCREFRGVPCDPSILDGLLAQLSRPASPYTHCGSRFGLRN